MLVVMDKTATPENIDQVVKVIEGRGCTARPIPGGDRVSRQATVRPVADTDGADSVDSAEE